MQDASLNFQSGELVEILIDRCHTPDGLTTTHAIPAGIQLYEKILLENYPSFNDFAGNIISCDKGQLATVMRYVGRPRSISSHKNFWCYDVYEILVKGYLVQVFANNLSKIDSSHDMIA
jgi:hypothetical protein